MSGCGSIQKYAAAGDLSYRRSVFPGRAVMGKFISTWVPQSQFFELGTTSVWTTLVGGAEVWFNDFPLRTSLTVLPTLAGLSTLGGQGDTATYLGEARFDATVAFGSVSHISLGFGLSGGAVGIGDLSGDRTVSGTGDMHAVVLAAIPQRLRLSARLRYVFADRKARNAGYPAQTWVSELGFTFRLR